ncbi:MAG: hypothetical protein ABL951_09875 [Alphaproteobacteria bacterium]
MRNLITAQWRSSVFCASILVALFCGAASRAGAEPVALVLDITGEVIPALEAFTEITAGSSFDLGTGGRLNFLHYPTCQKVLVEGGKLSLSSENFRISKGKVIDMSRAECPQRVVLASADSGAGIAGVVLRGASDGALKVSQQPGFLLLGASASQFKQLEIMQGKNSLLQATLGNKPVYWPETLDPLQAGGEYSVVLTGASNMTRIIPLAVTNQTRQKAPAIIQLN